MTHYSCKRIGKLIHLSWHYQLKQILLYLILLDVLFYILRFLPDLFFGEEKFSDPSMATQQMPFSLMTLLLGSFIFFYIWLGKTLYKSSPEPYCSLPASIGEKYTCILLISFIFFPLAALLITLLGYLIYCIPVPAGWAFFKEFNTFAERVEMWDSAKFFLGMGLMLTCYVNALLSRLLFRRRIVAALIMIVGYILIGYFVTLEVGSTSLAEIMPTKVFTAIILNLVALIGFIGGYFALKRLQEK